MTAIKTDYFKPLNLRGREVKEEADKNGSSEEEIALYDLSLSPGWKYLKDHIDDVQKQMEEMTLANISAGQPFEEIGRAAVVSTLVKDVIKNILNKVSYAVQAVESNRGDGSAN